MPPTLVIRKSPLATLQASEWVSAYVSTPKAREWSNASSGRYERFLAFEAQNLRSSGLGQWSRCQLPAELFRMLCWPTFDGKKVIFEWGWELRRAKESGKGRERGMG